MTTVPDTEIPDTEFAAPLTQLRHDLHRHPEQGLDLPLTQGQVLDQLRGFDLQVTEGWSCSSVTTVMRGGACAPGPRPVVLLRADMDALPVSRPGGPLLPLANGQVMVSLMPGARFEAVPGMGHGFFSPGIPAKIAMMMLDHTTTWPVRDAG